MGDVYYNPIEKISKELAKQAIDRMFLPFNYRCAAKFFVDGCNSLLELAGVMTAVSLRMPIW